MDANGGPDDHATNSQVHTVFYSSCDTVTQCDTRSRVRDNTIVV
jgi:hypothetical protein